MAEKNPKKRTMAAACSYLPDELWERIIKFLNGDNPTLKSLSVVCKSFLPITNSHRLSVKITDQTVPFLPRLFERFPNLTSLDLTHFSRVSDVDGLLTQISTFTLDLKLVYLSKNRNIDNGLRDLFKKMKSLTSFTYYKVNYIHKNDLSFIADCFPLLEEHDLSLPKITTKSYIVLHEDEDEDEDDEDDDDDDDDEEEDDEDGGRYFEILKHCKINMSGDRTKNQSINYLLKNCDLEDVIMADLVSCKRWPPRRRR